MHTVNVDLGERRYPIYIGRDLLGEPGLLSRHLPGQQVMLVSNDTVAPLYLDKLLARSALGNRHIEAIVLPDGERHKTLSTVERVFDALLEHRFDRNCTLAALGGGVVGDIAGFAAACYRRGVHFVQLPTTLLAQVDSSVGGKTGVNHPLGKNMICAFYQPRCVLIDTATLDTLADRELSAGLAEVIKYGLVYDAVLLDWLEEHLEALLARQPDALAYAIRRACEIKAGVVAADERENGARALLNLGHTFGHAIEAGLGYGAWLHGEAVAAGTVLAAELSARRGWLNEADVERVVALLRRARLPVHPPPPSELSNADFLRLMAQDKKVQDGRLRFILLRALGEGVIVDDVERATLLATLDAHRP